MKIRVWIIGAVFAVATVLGGLFLARNRSRQMTPITEPRAADQAGAEEDRQLVESVLKAPEQFEQTAAALPSVPLPVESAAVFTPVDRPKLLSSAEKPALPQPLKEPVKAENLYFWTSYASLRKDEIRNPDSVKNREGVVSLLKARQRRQPQKDF